MPRLRIILSSMPRLLRALVGRVLAHEPDATVVPDDTSTTERPTAPPR